MKKRTGILALLLTAFIWGIAFVAQSAAMNSIGPWLFTFSRSVLASGFLLALILIRNSSSGRKGKIHLRQQIKSTYRGGIACGTALAAASMLQQSGIQYTQVARAGFLTALYCLIVPLFEKISGRKENRRIYFSVLIALIGLYLLCMDDSSIGFAWGDILELLSAAGFAIHILLTDHFSKDCDGIVLSWMQFVTCAIICGIGTILFETWDFNAVRNAAVPILYAGICSSGVGYTLQIYGQKNCDPAAASIILCLESVFASIGGWLILQQKMSGREIVGCVLMFVAITAASLSQNDDAETKKAPAKGS